MNEYSLKVIARMHSDFKTKFGIPRQSGIVGELHSTVVFEPEYRSPEALRGIEEFSHIWLIWQFSQSVREGWNATVRPPRLGGNIRMGVFATRSPFRPNALGLSCVKLDGIEDTSKYGTVLHVSGADLMDGTPIYDIKPYVSYADSHPEASGGFTGNVSGKTVKVNFPQQLLERIPPENRNALAGVLEHDPRPSYQNDPERIYGFVFAGSEVKFRVAGDELTVTDILPENTERDCRKISFSTKESKA